ncbi:AtpZ/AtpI family protein [Brumimicrobium sp.]|uniref:AtpZ/AtpI family protein n=1 Tax=Brumimicrobium sp. TaxID=2029867 RepID=UPI003A8FBCBE
MDKKKKNVSQGKTYIRFSGIAIQMGVIIAAGALGGQWLDEKQGNDFPIWTLVLTLFAIFASLYKVIREVIKMGKDEDDSKG